MVMMSLPQWQQVQAKRACWASWCWQFMQSLRSQDPSLALQNCTFPKDPCMLIICPTKTLEEDMVVTDRPYQSSITPATWSTNSHHRKTESSLLWTVLCFLEGGSTWLGKGSMLTSASFSFWCFEPWLWEGVGVDEFGEACKGILKQKVLRAEKSQVGYGEGVENPCLLIGVAGDSEASSSRLNELKLIADCSWVSFVDS